MDRLTNEQISAFPALDKHKFQDPITTLTGEQRAEVALSKLETLWFNTGTLCNIACINCYIGSSPTNDALGFISAAEVGVYLDEIAALDLGTREIGFTGGEPFMNPDMIEMARDALTRGFEVLILTNAMQPMQRKSVSAKLLELKQEFGTRLTLRISLDHHGQAFHEIERGADTWDIALKGIDWLSEHGFKIAVAGRTCWGELEAAERDGYRKLFRDRGYAIDADDTSSLVLFPEMDTRLDIAEITTGCWSILDVDPAGIMCATSRMIVKRRGDDAPGVLPCTVLPFDGDFHMGSSLAESLQADGGNFNDGAVRLNHPHCARFCVLGGGSCSKASD
jgi:MoaA/NifB/PqqE/SkfB family radical SAM enzyme